MEIDIEDLEFHEHAGGGAYGSVYKAFWKSRERIVAVKKLLAVDENELQVLSMLSHRNIIQFYCAVTRAPNFCLVTEYASKGSLYNYLHKHSLNLAFGQILAWAREIALGVNYLHNEAPIKVIHRDLKSKNVVIAEDMTVKLCDFGCSRVLANTTRMSLAGTFPWMAPEIIQQNPVSEKCDVFSYGVLLWELLTREVPFKGLEGVQVAWLVVAKNERLTVPSSCPPCFSKLMTWCWKKEPKERPDLRQVLDELQAMARDDTLSNATESFLHSKATWMEEIETTLSRLKRLENDLNLRENQLLKRELKLSERERELESLAQIKTPENHDVTAWSEKDVYAWIRSLGVSGYGRDLAMYAQIFMDNNINGKRILMLTDGGLQEMGILSVGHRVELTDEIDKLRRRNERMRNFPPLVTQLEVSPATLQSITATFAMGMHCRRGTGSDIKYKMYLELDDDDGDDDDNDNALSLVKEVAFIFSKAVPIDIVVVSQAPFCMGKWRVGKRGRLVEVECVITFENFVKKPRSMRMVYDAELGTEIPLTIEKTAQLQLKSHAHALPTSSFQLGDSSCDYGSVNSGSGPSSAIVAADAKLPDTTFSYSHVLKTGTPKVHVSSVGGAWQRGDTSAALGVGLYAGESQSQVQKWPSRRDSHERRGSSDAAWGIEAKVRGGAHRHSTSGISGRTNDASGPVRRTRSAATGKEMATVASTTARGWNQVHKGGRKKQTTEKSRSYGHAQARIKSENFNRSSSTPNQRK
ncbi:mitogen-activated protein kinase kinase kinase 20-like isoform X2 [Oscarella lobularis]